MSQVHYKEISFGGLSKSAPVVVEAESISFGGPENPQAWRYQVVEPLKQPDARIAAGAKITVLPAGYRQLGLAVNIAKTSGDRRSLLLPAYRGSDSVAEPLPGTRYLLFLSTEGVDETFQLYAHGGVLPANARSRMPGRRK